MVAWTFLTVVSDVSWWHQCSTRAAVLLILISWFEVCVVARQQTEHGKMHQFQVLKWTSRIISTSNLFTQLMICFSIKVLKWLLNTMKISQISECYEQVLEFKRTTLI